MKKSTRRSPQENSLSFVSESFPSCIGSEWNNISSEAKALISKMLQYKPEDRISAADALNDPWMLKLTAPKTPGLTKSNAVALNSLRNFKVRAKLQQAVIAYIACHLQSQVTEQRLLAAFRAFDKNGDGLLEKSELIEGYINFGMNRREATKVVNNVMTTIDINKNGTIDYSEFLMANLSKEEMFSQGKLWEAFRLFDKVKPAVKMNRMATDR